MSRGKRKPNDGGRSELFVALEVLIDIARKGTIAKVTPTLSIDLAMRVITTETQRRLIKAIHEFTDVETLHRWNTYTVNLQVVVGPRQHTIQLDFSGESNERQLMPIPESAQGCFSTCRERDYGAWHEFICAATTLVEASEPWNHAIKAIKLLQRVATEPAQIPFYCPWIRAVGGESISGPERWIEGYNAPKPIPNQLLPLTPEQKAYLKDHGNTAVGQMAMLSEVEPQQQGGQVKLVMIDVSPVEPDLWT